MVEAGLPPEMVDGIEQRRTVPARPDDPAELHARLDALCAQAADAGAAEAGVADARSGPPSGGWPTLDAAVASAVAGVGRHTAAQDRLEQLDRWHTDDSTDDATDGAGDGAGGDVADGVGWSR